MHATVSVVSINVSLFLVIGCQANSGPAPITFTRALDETPEALPSQQEHTNIVVHGSWGATLGQFGQTTEPDSCPEMPMSLAIAPNGEVFVLDQINRRVQRFNTRGEVIGAIAISSSTASDIALTPNGYLIVLDRYTFAGIEIINIENGQTVNQISSNNETFLEPLEMTSVISAPDGIYIERNRDMLVRVADSNGQPVSGINKLNGRPTRDGTQLIKTGLIDAAQGTLYLQSHSIAGALRWEKNIKLPGMILSVLLLDSDMAGNIYLAAEIAEENSQTYELINIKTVVVQLNKDGQPIDLRLLPASLSSLYATSRPLALSDNGTIYQMLANEAGLRIEVYSFSAE